MNRLLLLSVIAVLTSCSSEPETTSIEPPNQLTTRKTISTNPDSTDSTDSTNVSTSEEEEETVKHFLETEYQPLNTWMNERFEIKYRAMTLELIFDQVPLSDIHYNTNDLKSVTRNAPFDFESEGISRRDLLKAIADHWDLDMKFETGEDDVPMSVVVFPTP